MEQFELNGFYTLPQKRHFMEAIEKRVSCRHFEGPPSAPEWAALSYAASRCCLKGVRIVLGQCDDGFFKGALLEKSTFIGVTRFAALIADTREVHYKLKAGISGEAFVLLLTDNDIATCWVASSYKKKESPVLLKPEEELLCVIALGKPLLKNPPMQGKRKALTKIIKNEYISNWPKWALAAAEAVRVAPSHQNIQPWEMELSGETLSFYGRERQALEMGIALLHAEAAIGVPHVWESVNGERGLMARVTCTEAMV